MTAKAALLKALYWAAKHAAGSYVAGAELEDALRVSRSLRARRWLSTLCPWDGPATPATKVFSSYQAALAGIAAADREAYLSIKLPSLNYDEGMLRALLEQAAPDNIRVHLDSLAPDTVDRTLTVLERLAPRYRGLGFTLPSRWQRSLSDARRVIDAGVPVRLVKGQFEDARDEELDPVEGYLLLVQALCGKASLTAVATHDLGLARKSLSRLKETHTPCELEQLYGLPCRGAGEAQAMNVPVRVYVPYDYGYLPYALTQLYKRPKTIWWLLRDAVRSGL